MKVIEEKGCESRSTYSWSWLTCTKSCLQLITHALPLEECYSLNADACVSPMRKTRGRENGRLCLQWQTAVFKLGKHIWVTVLRNQK